MGTLVVLNARTGAVLRRIAVGVAPQAIAVAQGSGQVVVVNGGGEVVVHSADWLAQGLQRLWAWLPWLGQVAPSPPNTRVLGSVSLIEAGA